MTRTTLRRWVIILAGIAMAVGILIPESADASIARPAAPAAAEPIVDGAGADYQISAQPHGDPAIMVASGGSTFTLVADGSGFELKASNGLCLTVNTAAGDAVYSESCSGASSTLWTIAAESGGGSLVTSVLLAGEDITGHLSADTTLGCRSADAVVFAEGGEPANNCHQSWVGV